MQAFHARYIFPVTAPPIENGYVTVAAGRIVELGTKTSARQIVEVGHAAILPGLINAHTHLELSSFDRPLGHPSAGFPAWIRDIVLWRRQQIELRSDAERHADRIAAVARGLAECAAAGVTCVADIASPDRVEEPTHAGVQVIPFQEVLGLATNRITELSAAAEQYTRVGLRGISPHAPYTVGVELLEHLTRLSAERKFPLAMHLAESPDELELLRSHSGGFYALLNELGAWDPAAIPRGIRILDYLKLLAQADRALVIHGNYLSNEEIDFLAKHRQRLTLVYCPRTHAAFGHPRYPLPELLALGVNVALGTDSRASNPDLNLWNELRFVADAYPELSLPMILSLATVTAAPILGRPQGLAIGQPADYIVVDLPDDLARDPYESLFDPASRVRVGQRREPQMNADERR